MCYSVSDAYILVSETISVQNRVAQGQPANNTNKNVIFKNCAPFNVCVIKINNTTVDNVKDIDIVMLMCNLIEYSNNYLKTSGSLWQYYRDKPFLDEKDYIVDFSGGFNHNTKLLKYEQKNNGSNRC